MGVKRFCVRTETVGQRHIFLSPHCDDAIGACGGLMQGLKNVVVFTVFTKQYTLPLSSLAEELHRDWGIIDAVESRKKENKNACEYLGVTWLNLDFLEIIYRTKDGKPICSKFKEIKNPNHPIDAQLVEEILCKIESYISQQDVIYVPMSFGFHADHVIVHRVGIKLLEKGYKVYFYQDFFYEKPLHVTGFREWKYLFGEAELRKKVEACRFYVSQMRSLFRSEAAAEEYICKTFDGTNACELYYEKI